MKQKKKPIIFENTNKPSFHIAGLLGGIFGLNADSESKVYYFGKNGGWKFILIVLLFPFILVGIALFLLAKILVYFIEILLWAFKHLIKRIKTRNEFRKNKRKLILKEHIKRTYAFTTLVSDLFISKTINFEDLVIEFFLSKSNLPWKKIVDGVQIIYSAGKIVINVSKIYRRKREYQMVIEFLNGTLDFKSDWKKLKSFLKLHIDVIQEVIEISKRII
ncbi:MAG: hypothetical protein PHS54_06035 [Clostridia bacterium]|nr:hypothetical protein [Clostridia bacterium]